MGGIIGAVRNNSIGIAGIAGGDSSINPGVSMYGFRVFESYGEACPECATIAVAHNFINGLIRTSAYTPDSTYGFGIHILNQSFIIWFATPMEIDSGYGIDSNIQSIFDAYRFAHRNQVVMPSATGNDGEEFIHYPAAIDDAWMLAIGGTGHNGNSMGSNSLLDEHTTNYGKGIDIAAPAASRLIYTTTMAFSPDIHGGFINSNGASSATAHASGVSALLISYLNDSVENTMNLAPEDVEYILQRSAFNVDSPGYDVYTGFGRLNAGGALSVVDKTKRELLHLNSESLTTTYTVANAGNNKMIRLTEREANNNGVLFDHKSYKADIYKIDCTAQFAEVLPHPIVGEWERHSSSFTYPYIIDSNKLVPHEKIQLESLTNSAFTASGYVYKLYDSINSQFLGWLPFDTAHAKTVNYAISALMGDTIYSPWDTLVSVKEVVGDKSYMIVYPNPSQDNIWLKVYSDCNGNVKLSVRNMLGQQISRIFDGNINCKEEKFLVNTANFSSGVYFVDMHTKCGSKSIKIIKL